SAGAVSAPLPQRNEDREPRTGGHRTARAGVGSARITRDGLASWESHLLVGEGSSHCRRFLCMARDRGAETGLSMLGCSWADKHGILLNAHAMLAERGSGMLNTSLVSQRASTQAEACARCPAQCGHASCLHIVIPVLSHTPHVLP